MQKIVETFLIENNINSKPVLVGFSTGPDSVCLALILIALKEKFSLDIILCYFNHNWRDEVKFEEEFCIDFAKKHNLKYVIEKASENIKKNEETARNLRYSFFENCAKKCSTDIVFLAHNKNDNVETLIYRLIKGTSLKGLTSIPKIRDIYYRPLLDVSKEEILEFLKNKNQNYMFDSSNDDEKYKRNLIRKKILPLFNEINPNYLNNINNLIFTLNNSRKIVEEEIKKIEKKVILNNVLKQKEYSKLEKCYRLEILNNYIGEFLKYRNLKNLLMYDDFILKNDNSTISLNSNLFLKVKNGSVFFEIREVKNLDSVLINGVGEYIFENITLKIEEFEKKDDFFPKQDDNVCFLNLKFPLVLRHRKDGDLFCPFGKNKSKKLKDYLIEKKIEQNKKDKLFLIADEKEILWVLGLNVSEKYKVKEKNCYKLTFEVKNG